MPKLTNKLTLQAIIILMGLGFLTSCLKQLDETRNWTVDKFYQEAHAKLLSGDYPGAITNYEKLQGRFPYSKQARQAEIEIIYAYYKYDEYDSTLLNADRFIVENPDHAYLDYVYYLRAITQYNKGNDILGKIFPQDISWRDPAAKIVAYKYFAELIKLFPNSKYYRDSLLRMIYLNNKLAEHEINVAKFYQRKQAFVAAINRSKKVIKQFPQTTSVTTALHILVDAYQQLGYIEISAKYQKIIETNKPSLIKPVLIPEAQPKLDPII